MNFMEHAQRQNQPLILLDTWSNKATSSLIEVIPSGSRILLLGNLSEKAEGLTLNTSDLFLRYKTLEGFNLLRFLREDLSKDRMREFLNFIRDDFDQNTESGGKIFRSEKIKHVERKEYQIEQIQEAIKEFEEKEGKIEVVIKCNQE